MITSPLTSQNWKEKTKTKKKKKKKPFYETKISKFKNPKTLFSLSFLIF